MDVERTERQRIFLLVMWTFVAYLALGMVVAWLEALPASNGMHGNVHTVGSQAIWGNGTALSPPLDLLAIVALFALAATRRGWVGRVGAIATVLFAAFYFLYGDMGELTTSTSPLTGSRWDVVLAFDSTGLAIAAVAMLTAVWALAGSRRSKRTALSPG